MKRNIICIALLVIVNGVNAKPNPRRNKADNPRGPHYMFVNASGRHFSGYSIQVADDRGTLLKELEKDEVAYIPSLPRYVLTAFKHGDQKGSEKTFAPEPLNDRSDMKKEVLVLTFNRIFPRGIKVHQYTLEDARNRYGNIIPMPAENKSVRNARAMAVRSNMQSQQRPYRGNAAYRSQQVPI